MSRLLMTHAERIVLEDLERATRLLTGAVNRNDLEDAKMAATRVVTLATYVLDLLKATST